MAKASKTKAKEYEFPAPPEITIKSDGNILLYQGTIKPGMKQFICTPIKSQKLKRTCH